MVEFTFETQYDQKALTAMAKGLRKTVRKKHSIRTHIFGTLLAIVCSVGIVIRDQGFLFTMGNMITWAAAIVILTAIIWEDRLNGYFAGKKMLKGMEQAVSVFREENYTSATELGESKWVYSTIVDLAETEDYFIFVFSNNHAQVYDKNSIQGGSVTAFRNFLERKTGKQVKYLK